MTRLKVHLKMDANWRWIKVIWPFLATVALLVGLSAFSMDILSSVRAFAGGESLYSKAQKDAVLDLNQYAQSHEELDYQRFLHAVAVPLGDGKARSALDQPDPNLDAVRQGFLAGRNHQDDIGGMIRLFRNFRHVSYVSEIVAIWTEADSQITALNAEANQLHVDIISGHYDDASLRASLARIKLINLRFAPLEDAFSFSLGSASRKIQYLLLLATLALASALMAGGSFISRSILQKKEEFENALRISEERLQLAMRGTSDGLWDWDILANVVYYSPRLNELLERAGDEILYTPDHFLKYVYPQDLDVVRAAMKNYLRDNASYDVEFRILTKSGKLSWVRSRAQSALNSAGRPVRIAGSITDVTERKRAALELTRTNRALQMLSRCNEALIRVENEDELLLQICHMGVDIGGYRLAWVAYAQDDEARTIKPMAQAGHHDDTAYLAGIRLSWSEDESVGRGPAGRTIRGGVPVVVEDVSQEPGFSPWLAKAQRHGYRGSISLPLRDKGRTFGLLGLYSSDVLSVSADEIKLLQELADDLAFGITNIRARDEQRRIQSAVLKIAAGVSASTGTEFFEQLARNMAEALGASAAFVARLLPGEPLTVRTIAAVFNDSIIDNFDYVIEGSPCENLLATDSFIAPDKVAMHYSLSPSLMAVDAQAYVGRRLDNSAGQPVGLLFVLFRDPLKRPDFITSTLQIFAARAAAEMERQETDARIRDQASLLDKAQDAITVRRMDQRILFWNKSAERLYGWTQEEALGRSIEELFVDNSDSFIDARNRVLDVGEWSGEITKRRKDGSTLTVESRWTLVRGDDAQPQSILAIDTDITQRKAAEHEIQHLAFYDPLTLLPNRLLLMDRLQQVLVTNPRSGHTGALLFIDLDNFKTINDTLGHDKGDLLLQQVALRLANSVRAGDTVARLGGDEFVVMLLDLGANPAEAAVQAKAFGEKILVALGQSYRIAGLAHHSTSSIGIALFNNQQDTVGELLKQADLAMYQAKAAGRNAMRFFDPEMQAALATRTALEADLRQALSRHQFRLVYQPQIDSGGHMMAVEALVRWQHPQHGLVSPADFIPLAEDTGLIMPLGQWVLETACAQLAAWAPRAETARLNIAVNVSVRQFRHPDFVSQVMAVLAHTGADPKRLKLEITESLMVNDMEVTIAKMTALKAEGVSFSLDDFGTGYSSLFYLKSLPLDQLKIDQSFVKDVLTDPNDAAIARTIVALAQSLGLEVIAEGVETEAQRGFLARNGCRAYQGYLFSRPLPIEKLEAFMRENLCAQSPEIII